jgi:hypothetical protein
MDPRTRVMELFRNLPGLNFLQPAILQLNYAEPGLQRPSEIYEAFQERKANRRLHPTLQKLFDCLRHGVSKLEYGRTSDATWNKYFRFAADHLSSDPHGNYTISTNASEAQQGSVNITRARAEAWFRDELVQMLVDTPRTHVFLIGDPGAGKSTLMKFLINTNSDFLRTKRTIFSRFEFLKFYYRWFKGLDSIRTQLTDYITFILLRDILYSQAFARTSDTASVRTQVGPFSDLKSIAATLRVASKQFTEDEQWINRSATTISDALGKDGIDFPTLRRVPLLVRIFIIQHFARSMQFALVLDGLDCISIEDQHFDTERVDILRYIMRNRTRLTDFGVIGEFPATVDTALAFVMRENTFFLYRNPDITDVKIYDQITFRVQKIDPRTAIYNAVTRAVDRWAYLCDANEQRKRELVHAVMKSIFMTLGFLNHAIGAGHKPYYILQLFEGNIRLLFTFLERLLEWFIEDGLRGGELSMERLDDIDKVLNVMIGPGGFRILRQRSYRIIELLLFAGIPWFENAIVTRTQSSFAVSVSPETERRTNIFRENEFHTGFVDNIFNYHVHSHDNDRDRHSLLEKIRIIQLLRGKRLTSQGVERELLQRLGYKSPDIDVTLAILVRTQMLHAVVIQNDDIYLSATERGVLVIDYLCRTMSYLEHVFHRTLFPEPLVRNISDTARTTDIDVWTAVSIRNVFIFLAYLYHVEENRARSKPVPESLRIFASTHQRVLLSLDRILADPVELKPRAFATPQQEEAAAKIKKRREQVAKEALRLIRNLLNYWDRTGCTLSRYGIPK